MEALAKSSLSTLKNFTVVNEQAWFADGRETCIVPLISFLERQYRLWKLDMDGCDLSDDQWNQIKSVVSDISLCKNFDDDRRRTNASYQIDSGRVEINGQKIHDGCHDNYHLNSFK